MVTKLSTGGQLMFDPVSSEPAYTRLDVDERRRRLLELGAELFTRFAYDELSMAKIAREAGISKALLYHYWPSKEAYFVATLEEKAAELQARTQPDPALEPMEQLAGSLDAYLGWIEENADSYDKMIRSAGAVAEVRAMLDQVRGSTAQRIVDGLRGDAEASPALRTAVRGWLGFMDGACLDWIAHDRDLPREALQGLLLGTLMGAVLAAEAAGEPTET
jgi:AcrR family transcriptional regulator